MISPVPYTDMPLAWPTIAQYIYPLAGGELKKIYLDVHRGHAQAWFIHEGDDLYAVGVTAITLRPEGRVLELIYLSGRCKWEAKDWQKGNKMLTEIRKHEDALWIELRTTRKINRLLKSLGWQQFADFWWRT